MSTQAAGLSTELRQQIEAFQKEMLPKMPAEAISTLLRTTEDLVKSGIADKALKVGDLAPDFALPDVHGQTMRLSEVLASGPAVVAFYRGAW